MTHSLKVLRESLFQQRFPLTDLAFSEQSLLSLHPLSLTTVIAYMTGSVCFITSLQTSLRLGIIYAEDKVNQIYSFLGTFWFVRYLIGNFGLSYVML